MWKRRSDGTETTEGKFVLDQRNVRGLAQASKIDRAHMGEIERGDINVTVRTASKVARALGMTLADLLTELEGGVGRADG